jgi:hypothetical protein
VCNNGIFSEGRGIPGLDQSQKKKNIFGLAMLYINENYLITTVEIIDELQKKKKTFTFFITKNS